MQQIFLIGTYQMKLVSFKHIYSYGLNKAHIQYTFIYGTFVGHFRWNFAYHGSSETIIYRLVTRNLGCDAYLPISTFLAAYGRKLRMGKVTMHGARPYGSGASKLYYKVSQLLYGPIIISKSLNINANLLFTIFSVNVDAILHHYWLLVL